MVIVKYQGFFSMTGAIFTIIALGNILPFSILSSYITSDNNPNIYPSLSLFYFSIALVTSNFANLFSMVIASVIGTKILSLLGFLLIGGGYAIFYIQTSLLFHYIAMGLIGMGIGLQFNPIMHNLWNYYPSSKGFISLFFILFYGFSGVLFSLFIEFMFSFFYIEGGLETAESKKEEILSKFFLITLSCISSLGILGLFLITNHRPEFSQEEKKPAEDLFLLKEKTINDDDNMSQSNYNEMEYSKDIPAPSTFWPRFCSICFSLRFCAISLMFFFSFVFSFLFTHSIRFIGIHNAFDPFIISISAILYTTMITLGKIILSLLYNVISFKLTFTLILVLQILLAIVIPFVNNGLLFLTFVCFGGFCYAGNSSLLSPLINKIYGIEHSFEISGFAMTFSSLSVFVVPVISFFFNQSVEIELFLKYLYFGSIGTSVIAIALCLSTNDWTHDYSHLQTSLAKELKKAPSRDVSNWLISDVKSERNSN